MGGDVPSIAIDEALVGQGVAARARSSDAASWVADVGVSVILSLCQRSSVVGRESRSVGRESDENGRGLLHGGVVGAVRRGRKRAVLENKY